MKASNEQVKMTQTPKRQHKAITQRPELFGVPVNYYAAIIGTIAVISIIVALSVDILWIGDWKVNHQNTITQFTDIEFGWKEMRFDEASLAGLELKKKKRKIRGHSIDYDDISGSDANQMDIRGQVWIVMSSITLLAAVAAIFGAVFAPKHHFTVGIVFAFASMALFVGCIVIGVYMGEQSDKVHFDSYGSSPIIALFAATLLAVSEGLLLFCFQ